MKRLLIFLICALSLASCAKKSEITVMSFNIRLSPNDSFDGENSWLYRKEAAVRMLNEVSPDLFGIQEGIYAQVQYLVENLPQYAKYGVGRDDGLDRGEANAIFYKKERFELVECNTFWLSATPDTVSRGWDGACNRVVTWARLKDKQAGGKEIFFFNTHFDHVGQVARSESGRLIVEKMKELVPEGAPVFLTGDFNANYDDAILDPLRDYMGMARETAPVSDTLNTFHRWSELDQNGGGRVIDHIFYINATPSKFETLTGHWGAKNLSDHYPIMAWLCF